jgi:hypothetical protein
MFAQVEGMFHNELNGMKSLEDEIRAVMTEVFGDPETRKRRSGGTPLTFMSGMFENLISLRNARLSAVKDIAGIKKIAADLQLKTEKGEGDEEVFSKVASKLMEMMTIGEERQNSVPKMPRLPNKATLELLDAAAEEAAISTGAPDPKEAEQAAVEKYVVDKGTGDIYLIDKDYKVIATITEVDNFEITRNKKGIIVFAINLATGEKLEVVE